MESTMYDYRLFGAGFVWSHFSHMKLQNVAKSKKWLTSVITSVEISTAREIEGIQRPQVWCPHFPYLQQKSVGTMSTQFAEFNNYINSPVANYKGSLYNLPFNMNTFLHAMWEPRLLKEVQGQDCRANSWHERCWTENLEEQAIKLIGPRYLRKVD